LAFKVGLRFMLVTVYMRLIQAGLTIPRHQYLQATAQPAQAFQALLAIGFAGILSGLHRGLNAPVQSAKSIPRLAMPGKRLVILP
jgi:hypothetical protein